MLLSDFHINLQFYTRDSEDNTNCLCIRQYVKTNVEYVLMTVHSLQHFLKYFKSHNKVCLIDQTVSHKCCHTYFI